MRAKHWLAITCCVSIGIFISIYSFIYLTDPYGYFSQENKFINTITRIDNPNVIHNKILIKDDIYLIGSSRQMRINPLSISKYTMKTVQNISIRASTFDENLLLAKKIKSIKKNFIFGFDAFFLNQERIKSNKELKNRLQAYQNELKNEKDIYCKLFNMDLLSKSFEHMRFLIKQKKFDFQETKENNYLVDINKSDLLSNFYDSYSAYSDEEIIKLGRLADKNDIFIIFPKHAFYYKMFQEKGNVEKQYFHAIQTLVNNTEASVWSFYDVNPITTDNKNFDDKGWHFKPKIGEEMLKLIYTGQTQTELKVFKLTKSNILEYLEHISLKVKMLE